MGHRNGPIHVGGSISGSGNFANVEAGGFIGDNNTIIVTKEPLPPEVLAALVQRVDGMAGAIAEMAHAHKLQHQQVALLAGDLARIKTAITNPEPDEAGFNRAASDLWNKLMMIGNTVGGVSGLADGLRFIATTLGWTLVLPGL